ncbi:MAG: hypothetical protein K0R10_2076, partial [Alphaproteobacteria bacterium]|nr:hypothetical protein [Alphaproteobacteria bacterium]
ILSKELEMTPDEILNLRHKGIV